MGKVFLLLLSFLGLVLLVASRIAETQYERPPPEWPETDEDEDENDFGDDDRRKRSNGGVIRIAESEAQYERPPPEWPETDEDEDENGGGDRRKRSTEDYNYALAVHYSLLFYEAQQSGKLLSNNRIPWRGNSAMNDQGENGEDLSGGWYDAGDHVKFNLPMAFSTTLLAWGMIEFKDAYKSIDEYRYAKRSIKWTCNYFLKCHTKPDEYYYQVGDPSIDHKCWCRPEGMTMERPAYKCDPNVHCSDVAAETAAALTACSIIYKNHKQNYSADFLSHAKGLYRFATTYQGVYPLESYYKSKSFWDELAWAAIWLYRATNEPNYLADSEKIYAEHNLASRAYSFGWGDKKPGVQLLLYQFTKNEVYKARFQNYVDNWLPRMRLPYTPKGFVMRSDWGSNRYAANTAAVAIIGAYYGIKPKAYSDENPLDYVTWAKDQIDYILGAGGRSFMVGFGVNPPQRPHHRASSCPDLDEPCEPSNSYKNPGPNHHELTGAIVGGVDNNDQYEDKREDYVQNEVACDYNAGFQTAAIGLVYFKDKGHNAFANVSK